MPSPTSNTETGKHWWIKDKKFKRVRLRTIEQLAILYRATHLQIDQTIPDFVLWLENYIED